jgi:glycosyltransferase involved in cell wall biosynthesis
MRILVVAPHPFFTPRGTPFSVYYRTLVFAEQGSDIDLLTYGKGRDVQLPRTRIVRIPSIPGIGDIPVGPSWKKMVLDVFMMVWTVGLLLRHRHDVVHAHEESVFWCRYLKPLFRFRLIYDMHSSLPQQLTNFKFTKSKLLIGIFDRLEASCLRAADAVITICPDLRDYALKSGVHPDRHFLIENSIFEDVKVLDAAGAGQANAGTALLPPAGPGNGRLFLYAGTFEHYQGVDLLIRAFVEVKREFPDARLVLLGGNPRQVAEARRLAESIGSAAEFGGQVAKNVVMRWTAAADVLLSPRIHGTNTPLKIYEQLASGKPLIATRIWSHTQVLGEDVCFLVDVSPESIAAGMLMAVRDREAALQRARKARALYEREYSRPVYEGKVRHLLDRIA